MKAAEFKYFPRCGECGGGMRLVRGKHSIFWSCTRWPDCDGTHGAHPDGKPMGKPADKETKQARIKAHEAFDWIWQDNHMKRGVAYKMLAQRMGLTQDECHIGMFDVGQCRQVVSIMQSFAMLRGSGSPDRSRKPKKQFVRVTRSQARGRRMRR